MNVVLNWSSGKDAALSYLMMKQSGRYRITDLLTTVNLDADRIAMHGIRRVLLETQAALLNLPLTTVMLPESPDNKLYETAMQESLNILQHRGVEGAAFGDIFLEDLKTYREQQLDKLGIKSVFPLWKRDSTEVARLVISSGIKAIVVCVNERFLDRAFLGRVIDEQFLSDLPAGVDPCGEHGEYHSFVTWMPGFVQPVPVQHGEVFFRSYGDPDNKGFFFLDLELMLYTDILMLFPEQFKITFNCHPYGYGKLPGFYTILLVTFAKRNSFNIKDHPITEPYLIHFIRPQYAARSTALYNRLFRLNAKQNMN